MVSLKIFTAENILSLVCCKQWRSKEGWKVGARALGCRPWGCNSKLFAVILNVFFSKNLDQSMLKNAYY